MYYIKGLFVCVGFFFLCFDIVFTQKICTPGDLHIKLSLEIISY